MSDAPSKNPPPRASAPSYRAAGVDLDASDETLGLIREDVKATYTPQVLAGLGAFGGLFSASELKGMRDPVLVASTDGVGTKTKVASALGGFDTLGGDLVNHCVNDILVQGARPLFFLDYVATARLEPAPTAALIGGVAAACRAHKMPLLGGETAELPGVYEAREFDLVGTIVGVAEREQLVTGARVEAGDVILGLPSGGLQTNGYSLARRVLEGCYHETLTSKQSVGEALMEPHRSFFREALPLLEAGAVRAMAHITGGGLPGNLPRVLPLGLGAKLRLGWQVPEIFSLIQTRGGVSEREMYRVFNMGVGFTLIVAPEDAERSQEACPRAFVVGEIVEGEGVVFG